MVGLILGDGSLVKKYEGGGTYFKFAQGDLHVSYLFHVFGLFHKAGLVNISEPSPGTSIIKGQTYHWWAFSTISYNFWNSWYYTWYPTDKKVIPAIIESLLTPVAMAYWFIDDGGWTGIGIHLNTNGFTYEDVIRLAAAVRSRYGLKCTVHSRNRVYIWAGSAQDLIKIVRPFVHHSIGYKLNHPVKK